MSLASMTDRQVIQYKRMLQQAPTIMVEDQAFVAWLERKVRTTRVFQSQLYDYSLRRIPAWARFQNTGLAEQGIEHFLLRGEPIYRRD